MRMEQQEEKKRMKNQGQKKQNCKPRLPTKKKEVCHKKAFLTHLFYGNSMSTKRQKNHIKMFFDVYFLCLVMFFLLPFAKEHSAIRCALG